MNKEWYRSTIEEAERFFEVDNKSGLDSGQVIKRLKKLPLTFPGLNPKFLKFLSLTVLRNGRREQVTFEHLVPGDIVYLSAGNLVPADVRLVKVNHLFADESSINGNSGIVKKNTFTLSRAAQKERQSCMLFKGSFIASGNGEGIVVEISHKNRFKPKTKLIKKPFSKNGVIVNQPAKAKLLKRITLVIFDCELTDSDISDIIRKVQLSKNIACKFIVAPEQAQRLSQKLKGVKIISKPDYENNDQVINDLQFICLNQTSGKIRAINSFKQLGYKVLYVSEGSSPEPAMQAADLSLIVGPTARHDVIHRAALYAPLLKTSNISSILYNNR